jgi:CHAT domain-containing protein
LGEITNLLISFLENYPKHKSHLDILLAHANTHKIVTSLLDGRAQNLSADDFENVAKDGKFLFTCGASLLSNGLNYGWKDFLNLAIDLFDRSRKHFEMGKRECQKALMYEGVARLGLAVLEVNPVVNLEEGVKLCNRVVNEGFFKHHPIHALALMREGDGRVKLAELRINSISNLEKAIKLYKRTRNEGFTKNTPIFAETLLREGYARAKLANFGINLAENLENAVKLFSRARSEGFTRNTSDYANTLIDEGNARRTLAELGLDPEGNLKKTVNLCERARYEGFMKNTHEYAGALMNEGVARLQLAKLRVDSENNIEKAIELFERSTNEGFAKDTPNYAKALGSIGIARGILAEFGVNQVENLEEAARFFERARSEGFTKNTPDYANTLSNEGNARQRLAKLGIEKIFNLDRAESLYLEGRVIFSKTNNWLGLVKVNDNLGVLKYFRNEMLESYGYHREAIRLIEGIRSSIKMPEVRKDYFNTVVNTYKFMVFTCLALCRCEEAFRYAESAKGRAFVELLASEKKRMKGGPELIGKYKDVLRKMDEIETKLVSGKEKGELQRLKRLHDDLLSKIKKKDPEYYSVETVEPISLGELSEILNGRTLIEYFLGKKLAIFVVNTSLIIKVVNIDEKEVSQRVLEFTKLVDKIERGLIIDEEHAEEILKDFYRLLIKPIEELDLSEEIVIVPHGFLNLVPFQALKSDRYLIEDYKICFAQSATSLKFLRKGSGKGALVVGNPEDNLQFAEAEALDVAKLLDTEPILRSDAKKGVILKEIEGKEVLHFACHGKIDYFNPAFSRILLSDGSITAVEFMGLEMDANLMVLSACETGLAEIAGPEVEGLVRAIQYGGCRFVVASLWKVDDKSTKELFVKFYTEEGDVIDRLRKAMLSLMKEYGYGFYHWAPFQIYGI